MDEHTRWRRTSGRTALDGVELGGGGGIGAVGAAAVAVLHGDVLSGELPVVEASVPSPNRPVAQPCPATTPAAPHQRCHHVEIHGVCCLLGISLRCTPRSRLPSRRRSVRRPPLPPPGTMLRDAVHGSPSRESSSAMRAVGSSDPHAIAAQKNLHTLPHRHARCLQGGVAAVSQHMHSIAARSALPPARMRPRSVAEYVLKPTVIAQDVGGRIAHPAEHELPSHAATATRVARDPSPKHEDTLLTNASTETNA